MGVMGAIAPMAKKLWGRCPQVAPTGILLSFFETVKCELKIRIYHYASDKRCADFSMKMHQKRLAAGLCPDLLGELTALPRPPRWI